MEELPTLFMLNRLLLLVAKCHRATESVVHSMTFGDTLTAHVRYIDALHNFTKPGGCRDLILQCRELGDAFDPDELALNSTVNQVCEEATVYCYTYVAGAYNAYSNRSVFDMAHLLPDNQPPVYTTGWANRAWVQEELGVMVNFTADSNLVSTLFTGITGDAFRRAGLKDIEYLLDSGVKVSLIFGDRDYRCPWLGVEQLSLAANWTGADAYKEAGYEEIRVNDSYVGGVVKQHGALSFARVFDAGHDVAYSQPETVAKIQDRSLSGHDVATGRAVVDSSFSTRGPLSSWGWKNKAPASPPHECYIWSTSSCTLDQVRLITTSQRVALMQSLNSTRRLSTAPRRSRISLSRSLCPVVDPLESPAASLSAQVSRRQRYPSRRTHKLYWHRNSTSITIAISRP